MFAQESSPERTRTSDKAVNSRLLYQLSYRGMLEIQGLATAENQRSGKLSCCTLQIKSDLPGTALEAAGFFDLAAELANLASVYENPAD